ncbi:MAG TPA: coproporphyrinogen III oxidase family protein [Anaerolinea sp.]|nr:coproporphyrinogen III oxidase family protein [Anaerolinea sp.]
MERAPVERLALPAPKDGHRYMLYSHVPFCESLCPYCSFNRFVFNEKAARQYFASLRDEMRQVAGKGYNFNSLYVGGGTPTVMLDELAQTIDLARDLFDIQEVSCETNPNHLDEHLVEVLGRRVQRLSVGVQSFDDGLLKKINRFDRFGSGAETLERIQRISGGFASMNVDMIFNFPGQDEAAIRRDIDLVIASGANQTTFYPLMTSPSVRRSLSNTVGKVEFSREADFYALIVEELSRQYELSTAWTFSRKGGGLIDEYIVESEEYIGIGSGSFSYLNGALYVNTFSLDTYRQMVGDRKAPITGRRRFNKVDQMRYRFMMDLFGLRLDKRAWKERFGRSVERLLPMEMAFFQASGAFAQNDADAITLTPQGRYMLVVMMREFFSGINRIRDQARQAGVEEESGKANDVRPYSPAKA